MDQEERGNLGLLIGALAVLSLIGYFVCSGRIH